MDYSEKKKREKKASIVYYPLARVHWHHALICETDDSESGTVV